jgi:ABC-type nitrate/sulfonate/bicarbonate transport system substrate-binding protein
VAGLRGAPLVAVFYDAVSGPWSLVVDPKKIKTPKDFAGARCVAATGNKTATHIAEAAMIESLGGDPRAFQSIGLGQPPPFWIEALRVGSAECMIGFDAAWTGQAVREGYKVLAYLPKAWPMHTSGLAVAQATLKDPKKRALTVDVISVFLRAQAYVRAKENRAELAEMLRRWMGAPKGMQTEDYEAALAEMATLYAPKGYIEDDKAFSTMLTAAIKYGIFDPKEFRHDPTTVNFVKAGVVDQTLAKEAALRGGPHYRRR